jgi:hypothetical protein
VSIFKNLLRKGSDKNKSDGAFLLVSGTMRSGTSLLADLFYSRATNSMRHPDIAFSMEGMPYFRKAQIEFWSDEKNKLVEYNLEGECYFPEKGMMDQDKNELILDQAAFFSNFFCALKGKILSVCGAVSTPKVWGLKYTNAFRWFDYLSEFEPEAKLILSIRDPRNIYSSSLVRKNFPTLEARFDILISVLVLHEYIFLNSTNKRIKVVKYEDVVRDVETTINDLLVFLNLSPADYNWKDMRENGVLKNSSFGSESAGKITISKSPLSDSNTYSNYCSPVEIAFIENIFGNFLENYGYETNFLDSDKFKKSSFSFFEDTFINLMIKKKCNSGLIDKVKANFSSY